MNALIIGQSFVSKLKVYFQQKKLYREENMTEARKVSQTIDCKTVRHFRRTYTKLHRRHKRESYGSRRNNSEYGLE